MKNRRNKKMLFPSTAVLLILTLMAALLTCTPGKAESAAQQWTINHDISFTVVKDSTVLQTGGQCVSFTGSLRAACLEQISSTIFVLLYRDDGLYVDFYRQGSKELVCGTFPMPFSAENVSLEAGVDPTGKILYICCRMGQGSGEVYRIQETGGEAFCIAETSSANVIWNSQAAVQQANTASASSQESIPESKSESQPNSMVSSEESSAPESQVQPESRQESSTASVSSAASTPQQINRIYRCSGPLTVAELQQMVLELHPQQIAGQETVQVFTSKGVERKTGSLTTGDVLQDRREGKVETVQLVIPGDLCGGGRPNQASYSLLRSCVAGGAPLSGLTAYAADMTQPSGDIAADSQPELTAADLLLLKRAADIA